MSKIKQMKAAVIHECDGIEGIFIEKLPIPAPKESEIQIAVEYAGVNPVDWKIAEGLLRARFDYHFPAILGWDVAGRISALGKEVKHLKIGDPVFAYCRKDRIQEGSFAEYVCVESNVASLIPSSLTLAEASCIPLSALTAWQSLFNAGNLQGKEVVLIHAGAGGVGGFAIQFAKLQGATVLTTASRKKWKYVKQLGADVVIDYQEEKFFEKVRSLYPQGIDMVFDTVGGSTLNESYQTLKKGGRLLSILEKIDPALEKKYQIEGKYVFVTPSGEELKKIADLFEENLIIPPPLQIFPLEDVQKALFELKKGHNEGKIVLQIRADMD